MDLNEFLVKFDQVYRNFCDVERREFINHFIKESCESKDLAYLTQEVDKFKSDLIKLLPIEINENIFSYLDPHTLFQCCQVSTRWSHTISNSCKIWLEACKKLTDLDVLTVTELTDYKNECKRLLKRLNELKSGNSFNVASINVEINSIGYYNGIFATASNLVKFYKYNQNEWKCCKEFTLESRASSFRFDEKHLLVVTYFNTIDLYSLDSLQLIRKYEGHMAAITTMCFSSSLGLFISGSADSTLRFWLLAKSQCVHHVNDMIWPLDIRVELYSDYRYLVLSLNSDNFMYLTYIQHTTTNDSIQFTNASFSINLNQYLAEIIEIDFMFSAKTRLLQLFKVIKSKTNNENSNYYYLNSNTHFYNEWEIDISTFEEAKIEAIKKKNFNEKYIFYVELRDNCVEKDDLRILAFGKRYCILYDELNQFYFCDFTHKTINNSYELFKLFKINSNLNLNQRTQFCFGDKLWLNGFNLCENSANANDSAFVFAFYASNKNASFIINWKTT